MSLVKLDGFQNVVTNDTAYLKTTKCFPNTLEYLAFQMTNILRSDITRIQIKLGEATKPIWDVTGEEIEVINRYEGRPQTDTVLILPFSNPRARTVEAQFQGAVDFDALGVRELNVEITLGTIVGTPRIVPWACLAPPKVVDADARLLFRSLLKTNLTFQGAIDPEAKIISTAAAGGALLRRIFLGPPTATGLGIVTDFEYKRDSVSVFEKLPLAVNNAILEELGHDVPAQYYIYDAIDDDNESKAWTQVRRDKGGISQIPTVFNVTTNNSGVVPTIADVHVNLKAL